MSAHRRTSWMPWSRLLESLWSLSGQVCSPRWENTLLKSYHWIDLKICQFLCIPINLITNTNLSGCKGDLLIARAVVKQTYSLLSVCFNGLYLHSNFFLKKVMSGWKQSYCSCCCQYEQTHEFGINILMQQCCHLEKVQWMSRTQIMSILKLKKKKTYYTCCKESLGMVGRSYAWCPAF